MGVHHLLLQEYSDNQLVSALGSFHQYGETQANFPCHEL